MGQYLSISYLYTYIYLYVYMVPTHTHIYMYIVYMYIYTHRQRYRVFCGISVNILLNVFFPQLSINYIPWNVTINCLTPSPYFRTYLFVVDLCKPRATDILIWCMEANHHIWLSQGLCSPTSYCWEYPKYIPEHISLVYPQSMDGVNIPIVARLLVNSRSFFGDFPLTCRWTFKLLLIKSIQCFLRYTIYIHLWMIFQIQCPFLPKKHGYLLVNLIICLVI
jgi:hypothetical protein